VREDLLSRKVVALKPSGIRKFFDAASDIPDAISLGVGEPDFDTPWHIRDEGIRALTRGKTFYTSNAGLPELRREIAAFTERRIGVSYDPMKEIVITVGGSEAIDIALRAIINPGDEVLYAEPCFVSYLPCIAMADGIPVPLPLKEENQFRLTREELEAAITPKTKALMISFPNNPTGAVMRREDLEALVPTIIEHDLIVISDEIYADLTYGEEHVSIASLPGMKERTIVINGFSKAFAMTGWRLGYACAPKPLMDVMLKIHQYTIMCAATPSQHAAIEALRTGFANDFADVKKMVDTYNMRRRLMVDGLRDAGLECHEPMGAFYVFPSIKNTGLTCQEFCERLLYEKKVATVPGDAFGALGADHIRCSCASSTANIIEAVKRIGEFVAGLK